MKKVFLFFLACALGISASAQSFDLEAVGGTSLNGSYRFGAGLDGVLSFHPGKVLELGAGLGVRVGQPLEAATITEDGLGKEYITELGVPVFARVRALLPATFFVGVDGGYQFAFLYWKGGILPKGDNARFVPGISDMTGFFVEPHVGYRFGEHFGLSVSGQFMRAAHTEIASGTNGLGSSVSVAGRRFAGWSPRLFLRLSWRF